MNRWLRIAKILMTLFEEIRERLPINNIVVLARL